MPKLETTLSNKFLSNLTKSIKRHNERIKTMKIHGGPYQETGIADHIWCYEGKFVAVEFKVWPNEATGKQKDFLVDIIMVRGYGAIITFIKPEELETNGSLKVYKLGSPGDEYSILQNIMVDKLTRYYFINY